MKKYKYGKDEDGNDIEFELEDKDFLLITAIDNLAKEIERARHG